jgi:hypothetical protein
VDTTTDLARIAADLALLVERLLVLTVIVGITGGALLIAVLFVFLRIAAIEPHINDSARTIIRKISGKIDDIEFPPHEI